MVIEIKYVVIDSMIGHAQYDLHILENVLEEGGLQGKEILFLQFSNSNGKVEELLSSYTDFHKISLENKSNSYDIKTIFEYFSSLEGKTLASPKDKNRFGKKILYLDAVSNAFIRKFKSSQECPGFWNLAVGTFCRHGCLYCFLNLTMRIRPLCVEHLNFSLLRNNLRYFNRRNEHSNALLNAGESSDPLDNEPLLHIWNKIVELVQGSGNQILCLTKSNNIASIPEPDGISQKNAAIYSWSINPTSVVKRYEPHTATTIERLQAAKRLANFGFKIRFRVDPIMPLDLMRGISEGKDLPIEDIDLEEYFKLIDHFDRIGPELVTFGTFRALPPLFNFLKDPSLKKQNLVKNGKRFRLPLHYRKYLYEKLGTYTQDLLGCTIGICKDPTVDLPFATFKSPCQCMKLNKR